MPIVGTGSSQGKTVRWKTSGTSLASGSTYTLGVPTFTNDVIVFAYTNTGSPTLTSSTTGITWTQYKTTGGSAPQPTMLIGVGATAGITSIVVSGTVAAGGGYVLAVISGRSASPVIATNQSVWTGATGGGNPSGPLNLSSYTSPLTVGATAQFGSVSLTSVSSSTGFAQIQGSNSVTRSIVLFTSEEPTSPSTQQSTATWSNSQTGGILVAGLARA
jgi:hypothetical protein